VIRLLAVLVLAGCGQKIDCVSLVAAGGRLAAFEAPEPESDIDDALVNALEGRGCT